MKGRVKIGGGRDRQREECKEGERREGGRKG